MPVLKEISSIPLAFIPLNSCCNYRIQYTRYHFLKSALGISKINMKVELHFNQLRRSLTSAIVNKPYVLTYSTN